jgi:hypothetical protein
MADLFGDSPARTPIDDSFGRKRPATRRHTPTLKDHRCENDGCNRWGMYGFAAQDLAVDFGASKWWCREHVPDGYLKRSS